jgi:hypothetical protein
MLKIYVASSWKNPFYTQVVERLRAQGYDVYDFRADGFGWHEIDENWRLWTPTQMLDAHQHPRAVGHYKQDMRALANAAAVVAVLPFGLSAGMELGYAVGDGKHTIVYAPAIREADLMLQDGGRSHDGLRGGPRVPGACATDGGRLRPGRRSRGDRHPCPGVT